MKPSDLKPCPFCGHEVRIFKTDSGGNIHDDDYFNDPYSGTGYAILHPYRDLPEVCPISTDDYQIVGSDIYGSEEELCAIWNKRANS